MTHSGAILAGGNMAGHWIFHDTNYCPDYLGFESKIGTLADDECAHGKTPAERIAAPTTCACGGSPQAR